MTRNLQMRRVHVTVLVKAGSDEDARNATIGRLNGWALDPEMEPVPATASRPAGALLHYTVESAGGHRAVAA